ncbi:MAG: bifunctional isocitrate dehydrogenase kinase/phosphatase [Planctomycetales bacterium]|nr:bifunctional isocitrate dehydrogenase kinase/phosphatase [Planctomycetales bacterium]
MPNTPNPETEPPATPLSTSRVANEVARLIRDGFARFHDTFRGITRKAVQRFTQRNWRGLHDDARQRMEVRDQVLAELLRDIREKLGERLQSRIIWFGVKSVYSGLIQNRDDWEIAETFYNSVTRRIFSTVGIDPEIEFVHTDYAMPPTPSRRSVYHSYRAATTQELVHRVLADHPELLLSPEALQQDAAVVAARVAEELQARGDDPAVCQAEFATAVFYRGEHAYLVGRVLRENRVIPLVLCLTNDDLGPHVEAVLLDENDVSLLLSFTRSYFQVELFAPYDMVQFIHSLIPRKRVAEIYISLGYNKHGKTELYRNALRHLASTDDLYQIAEGNQGMVMIVFTRPTYPVVFKVIRDRFDFPKEVTRQEVIDRYHLIFRHDRAGRLVDAQEYEYLVLQRARFTEPLLEQLAHHAAHTVVVKRDEVIFKHCYAERRVTPLNVYLQHADTQASRAAVIDYGRAIKDLALTNLFPGDLLPKNFGVTRNGRVVFYDYDEVCLLQECNFRKIPHSGHYEDELSGEPWFGVSPHDIFPEEFIHFLGLSPPLRQLFVDHHRDLLDADYWNGIKQQVVQGRLFHVPPYAESKRLRRPG